MRNSSIPQGADKSRNFGGKKGVKKFLDSAVFGVLVTVRLIVFSQNPFHLSNRFLYDLSHLCPTCFFLSRGCESGIIEISTI
jgi:hypothetical protein